MQIDELPAGEQTQNPDLDMNQVVGTHDILMLCFDTLRYDVSKEEEAAGEGLDAEEKEEDENESEDGEDEEDEEDEDGEGGE